MFKALVIENDEQGYRSLLKDLPESQLPDYDVTLDVSYSSLNYKDALAICNKGPIVRQFPMVPGRFCRPRDGQPPSRLERG